MNWKSSSSPPTQPLIRHEFPDVVYRTEREKFNAAIEEIKEYHLRGQPVLVGSIAIEKSERLSAALKKAGVVPERLQELARQGGGLEGPKLRIWAERLAESHQPGRGLAGARRSSGHFPLVKDAQRGPLQVNAWRRSQWNAAALFFRPS